MKNSIWIAVIVIALFLAGVLFGKNFSPENTVKEITTITKWEPWPYPVEVIIEVEKLVPISTDPPDPEIIEKYKEVDSLAIMQEFLSKNHYDLDFSSDSIGTYIAHVDVQANQVVGSRSTIQPLTKIVETTICVERSPKFISGYATIGSSLDFQTAKVSFGAELRESWVLGASGMKVAGKWGYTVDFGIKF